MSTHTDIAEEKSGARLDASRRLIGLPGLRVVLVAVACTLAWVIVGLTAGWTPFPPPSMIAVVALLPVNLLCLALVRRRLHAEGLTARALIGYRPGRLGRDVLWGLLWLVVLSVPFAIALMLTMWLLNGPATVQRLETAFFDPEAMPVLSPVVLAVLAIVAVVTFAPLNAPTEELVFRGYAQGGLAGRWPIVPAILVPAAIFGLQHVWFAPTPDAVVAYACAFFVWGLVAGIIARRQGRLLPVIIAHFAVNLFLTLPALAVPFLVADGAS